ncbi:hypothetical protein QIU18_00290 [Capnocytophaga canimorsus]|nr:hypothetical protein [Capnocytophaga canimorsus]WGU70632.1 hypothetical protein QIU18_00290 [Capnocytophaga canimorsus]
MNLSQRVWKYTKQYKDQIETALDVGLGEGKSAAELSKDVRENLQNPDALFRRVRDKRGQLVLSKKSTSISSRNGEISFCPQKRNATYSFGNQYGIS